MNLALNRKTRAALAALLGLAAVAAVFQAPLRWTAAKLHREIFPERVPERPVYDETAKAPVDLATFVRDARLAWPKADIALIHAVALEVSTGLLMHADIEAGSVVDGSFVPWQMPPWSVANRVQAQLGAMPGFLAEPGRYVFRRKTS